MFLAVRLLFVFVWGLPVSFGIGALIGFIIHKFYRKHLIKKAKYYVVRGGMLYIVSQPIAFFFVVFLEWLKIDRLIGAKPNYLEGPSIFEMISGVLFALVFTTVILILLAKWHISKNNKSV